MKPEMVCFIQRRKIQSDAYSIGKNSPGCQYYLGPTTLTETKKDLAVVIANDLKSSRQVTKAAASASSLVGFMEKTLTCVDSDNVSSPVQVLSQSLS